MRTLIFGAKGQLGRDLMTVFGDAGEVSGHDVDTVDIADRAAVERIVSEFNPELIVNAAAYTDVEAAEGNEAKAFAVNETGAGILAASAGAPVVYYSTDYVFGGTKTTPYLPDDAVDPIGVYARSKEAGERATRAANARHFIVRTAWLYGPGGNNFVEKILRAASQRPSLRVVDDEVGSPTHTWDLALATRALAATTAYGTYHAVNAGACSRYEFALAILELAGLRTPVEPCSSAEFSTKAERPLYSVLSNAKLERATRHAMRPWRDALAHYVKRRTARIQST